SAIISLKPGGTMLLEVSVTNFRSIAERQTLSLVASTDKHRRERNVFEVATHGRMAGLSVLRSAVIYGPNAAGKSAFISAFDFIDSFVMSSAKQNPDSEIRV